MILYFADRHFNILGTASTQLPGGLVVIDDVKAGDVESGVNVFECKVAYDKDTRESVENCLEVGNFILRKHEDEEELYTILDSEIDRKKQTVYIYAEDAGMDLINEIVSEYEADQEYPIEHYFTKFAYDSGFSIDINEAEGMTRKLTFDKEETVTARLARVAAAFDNCEIEYRFIIEGLRCVGKVINIYKKRGQDLGETLRLNKEIDNIIIKKTIANIATALRATGATPDNADDPITLRGYVYDDGDFYVDGDALKSREALKRWSRYINPDEPNQQEGHEGHIVRLFDYDTVDQDRLLQETLKELKRIRDAEVNYEAEILSLPQGVKVGDRINIVDEAAKLYLSTRLLQLERSVVNDEHKAVLGEHLIKGSGIAQKVIDLAEQHAKNAEALVKAKLDARLAAESAEGAKKIAGDAYGKANEAYEKSDEAYTQASRAVQNVEVSGQYTHNVTVANALENSIENIQLYGKTTQSATPTPTAPVSLESVGSSGSVGLELDGEQIVTIPVLNGFPGIPMQNACTKHNYTDANGQKWFTDEIDFARGVYIQRFFTLTFDGTEDWKTASNGTPQIGSVQIPELGKFDTGTYAPDNGMCCYHRCSHFLSVPRSGSIPDGSLNSYGGTNGHTLQFKFSAYTGNLDGWKAWLASQAAAGTPVTVLLGYTKPVETLLEQAVAVPGNPAGNVSITSSGIVYANISGTASKSSVQNAQDAAEEAHTAAENATNAAAVAMSEIQQLADMISSLVTDGNGASLMTQTADGGWTFSMAAIQEALASGAIDLEGLAEALAAAKGDIESLAESLGLTLSYVKITEWNGQPCIELGETDSDFKLRITNTEIQFADGTVVPAYISNKKLMIEQAEITGDLQFGPAGGRNLLPRSKYSSECVSIANNSTSGFGFIVPGGQTGVSVPGTISGLNLKTNTDYTVSFTAWLDTTDANARQSITWDLWPDTLPQEFIYSGLSNVPQRFSWTIRSEHSDMNSCNMRLIIFEADTEGYTAKYPVYITDIKLEEGSRATVWTPAPEDGNAEKHGTWTWKRRENGNFGLSWKGADE